MRLWVDDRPLIDDWDDHSAREDDGTLTLRAGRKYDIMVEYYENSYGAALVQLSWSSASQVKEIVPQSLLYPGPPAPASLSGLVTRAGAGVAGARLTLSGVDDQGDAVTQTTTTAADGSYHFLGLRPGDYELTRDGPDGPGAGATAAADVISAIRLSAGEQGEGYDFTLAPPAAPPAAVPPAAVPPAAPPARAVVTTRPTVRAAPPAVLPFTREGTVFIDGAPPPRPLTPLQASDAVFILAGAFGRSAAAGSGGADVAAEADLPALSPPPAVLPLQTDSRLLPMSFIEEDQTEETARVAADDEAFIELAPAPAAVNHLFAEPASPPVRRAASRPASDDPNSVGQKVLLASAWMLTTMGAALANPLDYSRGRCRA